MEKRNNGRNNNRNGNGRQHTGGNGYHRQNRNYAPPAPQMDEAVNAAIVRIGDQLMDFIDVQQMIQSNGLDELDYDSVKQANHNLFNFAWGETFESNPDLHFYGMKRMKMDRESGLLKRADLNMFITDGKGVPHYNIEVYLTDRYTGSLTINRMNDKGVVRSWGKFYIISNGVLTEKS